MQFSLLMGALWPPLEYSRKGNINKLRCILQSNQLTEKLRAEEVSTERWCGDYWLWRRTCGLTWWEKGGDASRGKDISSADTYSTGENQARSDTSGKEVTRGGKRWSTKLDTNKQRCRMNGIIKPSSLSLIVCLRPEAKGEIQVWLYNCCM